MTDTKALTLDPQASAQAEPDQMVEVYADRLMDELFDGVERALDGDLDGLEASPAPKTETVAESELTLSFSEGGLPAVLLSEETERAPVHLPDDLAAAPAPAEATGQPAKKGWRRYWTVNRVLLGAAALSLLATVALWLHQRQQVSVTTSSPATTPADATTPSANAEFLEYVRRSLEVVAQQGSDVASTSNLGVPEVPVALNSGALGLPPIGNNTLPPAPMMNNVPLANGGSVNVIERVYIPYQATQAPTATAAPPPAASTATPPTVASAPVHSLVGVLELGDRSAALFEIDGVAQRVYIGERVGSSGWSLVSVSNEEAVVRRNGEVRSIYIGQRF